MIKKIKIYFIINTFYIFKYNSYYYKKKMTINIVVKSKNNVDVHTYSSSDDLPYATVEGQFAVLSDKQTPVFFSNGIWYDFCCNDPRTIVKNRQLDLYLLPTTTTTTSMVILDDDNTLTYVSGVPTMVEQFNAQSFLMDIKNRNSVTDFGKHPVVAYVNKDKILESIQNLKKNHFVVRSVRGLVWTKDTISTVNGDLFTNLRDEYSELPVVIHSVNTQITHGLTTKIKDASNFDMYAKDMIDLIIGTRTEQTVDDFGTSFKLNDQLNLPQKTHQGSTITYSVVESEYITNEDADSVLSGKTFSSHGSITLKVRAPGNDSDYLEYAPDNIIISTLDHIDIITYLELMDIQPGTEGDLAKFVDEYIYFKDEEWFRLRDNYPILRTTSYILVNDKKVYIPQSPSTLSVEIPSPEHPQKTSENWWVFDRWDVSIEGQTYTVEGIKLVNDILLVPITQDVVDATEEDDGTSPLTTVTITPRWRSVFNDYNKSVLTNLVKESSTRTDLGRPIVTMNNYSSLFKDIDFQDNNVQSDFLKHWDLSKGKNQGFDTLFEGVTNLQQVHIDAIQTWILPENEQSDIVSIILEQLGGVGVVQLADEETQIQLGYYWSYWLKTEGEQLNAMFFLDTKTPLSNTNIREMVKRYLMDRAGLMSLTKTHDYGPIGQWIVTGVTNMNNLFVYSADVLPKPTLTAAEVLKLQSEYRLFNEDITGWDVSNVVVFRKMFSGCEVFNHNLGAYWTFSNPEFVEMFLNAKAFSYSFEMSNMYTTGWAHTWKFRRMFAGCEGGGKLVSSDLLTHIIKDGETYRGYTDKYIREGVCLYVAHSSNVDTVCGPINQWDVSGVTSTHRLFYKCISFDAELNGWGQTTRNIDDMSYMFEEATSFGTIDLNDWNVENVQNMNGMFSGGHSSRKNMAFNGNIEDWVVSSVTNMSSMFSFCKNFQCNISGWDVSSVTTMSYMFWFSNFNQPLNDWGIKVSKVKNFGWMFRSSSYNHPLHSWTISSATNLNGMFSFNSFDNDLNDWGVSTGNVINFGHMFYDNHKFNKPLNNWKTDSVTTMEGMFYNARSFNQDLSAWNVDSVTNMKKMFEYAINFNSSLANWNVSNVTIMESMFRRASTFNHIGITEWTPLRVTNMNRMFEHATAFDQDISGWSLLSIKSMYGMFRFASTFNQPLGNWERSMMEDVDNNQTEETGTIKVIKSETYNEIYALIIPTTTDSKTITIKVYKAAAQIAEKVYTMTVVDNINLLKIFFYSDKAFFVADGLSLYRFVNVDIDDDDRPLLTYSSDDGIVRYHKTQNESEDWDKQTFMSGSATSIEGIDFLMHGGRSYERFIMIQTNQFSYAFKCISPHEGEVSYYKCKQLNFSNNNNNINDDYGLASGKFIKTLVYDAFPVKTNFNSFNFNQFTEKKVGKLDHRYVYLPPVGTDTHGFVTAFRHCKIPIFENNTQYQENDITLSSESVYQKLDKDDNWISAVWSSQSSYVSNDRVVVVDDGIYKLKDDISIDENNNPSQSSSKWEIVTSFSGLTPDNWDNNKVYESGNTVFYNNNVYKCNENQTGPNKSPSIDDTRWEKVHIEDVNSVYDDVYELSVMSFRSAQYQAGYIIFMSSDTNSPAYRIGLAHMFSGDVNKNNIVHTHKKNVYTLTNIVDNDELTSELRFMSFNVQMLNGEIIFTNHDNLYIDNIDHSVKFPISDLQYSSSVQKGLFIDKDGTMVEFYPTHKICLINKEWAGYDLSFPCIQSSSTITGLHSNTLTLKRVQYSSLRYVTSMSHMFSGAYNFTNPPVNGEKGPFTTTDLRYTNSLKWRQASSSWSKFEEYLVGDVIMYNNSYYRTRIQHGDIMNTKIGNKYQYHVPTSTTYWTKISNIPNWSSSTEYTKNQCVRHNSTIYQCLEDHINHEPPEDYGPLKYDDFVYGTNNPDWGIVQWNTMSCTNMSRMFKYMSAKLALDLSQWLVHHVSTYVDFVQPSTKYVEKKHITFPNFTNRVRTDKKNLRDAVQAWMENKVDAEVIYGHISQWLITDTIEDMSELFQNYENFDEDISAWNVKNVNNFESMFEGCTSFTQNSIVDKWSISSDSNMKRMFYGCTSFSANLTPWIQKPWSSDWTDIITDATLASYTPFPVTNVKLTTNNDVAGYRLQWSETTTYPPPGLEYSVTHVLPDMTSLQPTSVMGTYYDITDLVAGVHNFTVYARVRYGNGGTYMLSTEGVSISVQLVQDGGISNDSFTEYITKAVGGTRTATMTYSLDQTGVLKASEITVDTEPQLIYENAYAMSMDNTGRYIIFVQAKKGICYVDLDSAGTMTTVMEKTDLMVEKLVNFHTDIVNYENNDFYFIFSDSRTVNTTIFSKKLEKTWTISEQGTSVAISNKIAIIIPETNIVSSYYLTNSNWKKISIDNNINIIGHIVSVNTTGTLCVIGNTDVSNVKVYSFALDSSSWSQKGGDIHIDNIISVDFVNNSTIIVGTQQNSAGLRYVFNETADDWR